MTIHTHSQGKAAEARLPQRQARAGTTARPQRGAGGERGHPAPPPPPERPRPLVSRPATESAGEHVRTLAGVLGTTKGGSNLNGGYQGWGGRVHREEKGILGR